MKNLFFLGFGLASIFTSNVYANNLEIKNVEQDYSSYESLENEQDDSSYESINKRTNQPVDVDITQYVYKKYPNADSEVEKLCLGNACSGKFASARLSLDPNGTGQIFARGRLHNVHEWCVSKPWPLTGEVCADTYNYWVNIDVRADIVNCRVLSVVASSSNDIYKIPTAFASSALWSVSGFAFILNATKFC